MYFLFISIQKITRSETNLNNSINMTNSNWIILYWVKFLLFICLGFWQFVICTSESKDGKITFALIDLNWKEDIDKVEIKKIKYWLSRSNEEETFTFCPGNHVIKCRGLSITDFACSLERSSQNHQPLHSFEVNYKENWKIKFRSLNRFVYMQLEEYPFLFEYSLNVSYQEFQIFVKHLTFDSGTPRQNLTYENFYRFLKILDVLDPISSEYLNQFYSHLYRECLLEKVSVRIFEDSAHYRENLFDEKHRIRPFMYFFCTLINSIDACFIPKSSTLSLFEKKKQHIDECFRDSIDIANLILKISSSSLELLLRSLKTNEWAAFNWLLAVTKVSGFYIDNTELTFNELKVSSVCSLVCSESFEKCIVSLKKISDDFFLNLTGSNIRMIKYLKFVNVDISFDLLDLVILRGVVSYLEISYCVVDESQRITELLPKMYEPNTFKVAGLKMNTKDIERILYSKIKVLVLKDCTLDVDSIWKPKRDQRGDFRLTENLEFLDISLSKFPVCFVQLLLNSTKLENILLNSFEFTGCESFDQILSVKRNWKNFEHDQYIPNEYLRALFTSDVSVGSLCLRRIIDFDSVAFFFEIPNFIKSVKSLDFSDCKLTVSSLNFIGNFYNLKSLNLSKSLPSNVAGLMESKIYENLTHLDVSYNDIFLSNYLYITMFKNLKALSLFGVKMRGSLLGLILTDKMIYSLSYLNIISSSLTLLNFKRISECFRLSTLLFSLEGSCFMGKYCDICKSTLLGERLNILHVSTSSDISIDDVVALAEFHDLSEVKISCRTIFNRREKDIIKYDSIYSDFRIQFVLKQFIKDVQVVEILREIFCNYSISIIYEETLG
ncbi:hypothetical protein LUQ84_002307 [Hamiltosporidium tvaerminnensis]|nr:hypothetical protein LUQ84_002307 [Hamiltosporidium tvaerminnensis]